MTDRIPYTNYKFKYYKMVACAQLYGFGCSSSDAGWRPYWDLATSFYAVDLSAIPVMQRGTTLK